jgi:hypothetical protein
MQTDMCTVIGTAFKVGCVHGTEIIPSPTLEILIYCICDAVQFGTEAHGFWRNLQPSSSGQLIHNHIRYYTAARNPTEYNLKPNFVLMTQHP